MENDKKDLVEINKKLRKLVRKVEFYYHTNDSMNILIGGSIGNFVFVHPEDCFYGTINLITMYSYYQLKKYKNMLASNLKKRDSHYPVKNLLLSSTLLICSGATISYTLCNDKNLLSMLGPTIAYTLRPALEHLIFDGLEETVLLESQLLEEINQEQYQKK